MGWPLRMFEEEGYYFVTSRCFQGRLLRPNPEVNDFPGRDSRPSSNFPGE
jgi:hypothetical protein